MPRTGKCLNYAGCLLAYRNEIVTIPDGAPFVCPECGLPLVEAGGRTPITIPVMILGGISLLVIMGSGAVYMQARHLKKQQDTGEIGSSFEDAEIAGSRHEFLPSRHMETPPVALAYTQFSPGDPLDAVQSRLGLNNDEVRYRGSMPAGRMGMIYFLDQGNLHIDAEKNGDTWVLLSAPLLESATTSAAERVAEWDRGADAQKSRSGSQQ